MNKGSPQLKYKAGRVGVVLIRSNLEPMSGKTRWHRVLPEPVRRREQEYRGPRVRDEPDGSSGRRRLEDSDVRQVKDALGIPTRHQERTLPPFSVRAKECGVASPVAYRTAGCSTGTASSRLGAGLRRSLRVPSLRRVWGEASPGRDGAGRGAEQTREGAGPRPWRQKANMAPERLRSRALSAFKLRGLLLRG